MDAYYVVQLARREAPLAPYSLVPAFLGTIDKYRRCPTFTDAGQYGALLRDDIALTHSHLKVLIVPLPCKYFVNIDDLFLSEGMRTRSEHQSV